MKCKLEFRALDQWKQERSARPSLVGKKANLAMFGVSVALAVRTAY